MCLKGAAEFGQNNKMRGMVREKSDKTKKCGKTAADQLVEEIKQEQIIVPAVAAVICGLCSFYISADVWGDDRV